MKRALDFFRLFLTVELIQETCDHTNAYDWHAIGKKLYYGAKDGAWIETSSAEINKIIARIIYMGLVNASTLHRYWSTKTLYHGLWARSFMSRDRLKALMATLHVVDPAEETERDKLRKVSTFVEQIKDKCESLYQPTRL